MQCRRPGFYPWIGKITWRREKLTSSVFWPREFQGLSRPWHHKESDTTEQLSLTHCSFLYPKGFIQSSGSIRNHEIKSMERGKYQIRSVAQLCPTLYDPMNRSTPGLPVHHQLLEFTQTHVHWVSDAIQPSHPLSSPSPLAPNPSQHQSLFEWVNCSHEVARVLEFQL